MKKLLAVLLLSATTSAFGASSYTGASVGYLVDSKDAYSTGRLGVDVLKTSTLTHSVEAEVGFTRDSDFGLTFDTLPIMANYRLTAPLPQSKFSVFAGAGIGASRVKLKGWGYNESDWAFTCQTFLGVEYSVTPAVCVTAGARYLNIGTVTMAGIHDKVGNDSSFEAGLRIRFGQASRSAATRSRTSGSMFHITPVSESTIAEPMAPTTKGTTTAGIAAATLDEDVDDGATLANDRRAQVPSSKKRPHMTSPTPNAGQLKAKYARLKRQLDAVNQELAYNLDDSELQQQAYDLAREIARTKAALKAAQGS